MKSAEIILDQNYKQTALYVRELRRQQLAKIQSDIPFEEIMKLEKPMNDAQYELLSYLKERYPKRFRLRIQPLTDADMKQIKELGETRSLGWLTKFVQIVVKGAEVYDLVVFTHANMYGYPFFLDNKGWHGADGWRPEANLYIQPPAEYFHFLEHLGLMPSSAVPLYGGQKITDKHRILLQSMISCDKCWPNSVKDLFF